MYQISVAADKTAYTLISLLLLRSLVLIYAGRSDMHFILIFRVNTISFKSVSSPCSFINFIEMTDRLTDCLQIKMVNVRHLSTS